MKTRSGALARSALLAAVATVLICLCAVLPSGRVALTAIAGLCGMLALVHCGGKWAAAVYVVSAALSLLLAGDKGNALLYTCFLGYYPALKSLLERIHSKTWSWIAKFALFNAVLALLWFAARAVLMADMDKMLPVPLLWLGANFIFFVYDIGLSRLIYVYIRNFAGKMK